MRPRDFCHGAREKELRSVLTCDLGGFLVKALSAILFLSSRLLFGFTRDVPGAKPIAQKIPTS